jgi:hypothetical protein
MEENNKDPLEPMETPVEILISALDSEEVAPDDIEMGPLTDVSESGDRIITDPLTPSSLDPPDNNRDPPESSTEEPPVIDTGPPDTPDPPSKDKDPLLTSLLLDCPPSI